MASSFTVARNILPERGSSTQERRAGDDCKVIGAPASTRALRVVVAVLVISGGGAGSSQVVASPTAYRPRGPRRPRGVRDVVSSASAGEVTPVMHATIRSEPAGRVLAVNHQRGARVARNAIIVQLDPADLDARLRQAQSDGRCRHRSARSGGSPLRDAASTGRARPAPRAGGSRAAANQRGCPLRSAGGRVRCARSRRPEGAKPWLRYQLARVQRSRCELAAPFDGVLTGGGGEPGDSLSPGVPVFKSSMTLGCMSMRSSTKPMPCGYSWAERGATPRCPARPHHRRPRGACRSHHQA